MLPEVISENGEWFSGFLKESEVADRWGVDFQSTVSKGYPEQGMKEAELVDLPFV